MSGASPAGVPALLAGLTALGGCTAAESPDRPFRDEWRRELTAPFPYDPSLEPPGITRVIVGEDYPALGIPNRGDVTVLFDAPAQTIEIEMRRFAFAGEQSEADDHFARLGIVAVDAAGHDCTLRWWDGCTLTIAYAGQTPPARAGADLQLHLPASYRHHLEIQAHDVSDEPDYPDRANVCLEAFTGEATVVLDSGVAFVTLGEQTKPTPACAAEDLIACEAVGWAADCPCEFGALSVENRGYQRSDIVVDLPPELWARLSLTNVDAVGGACQLGLDVPAVVPGTVTEQHVEGEVARPATAEEGATGYRVDLRSTLCGEVAFVSGPDEAIAIERRGDLRVCSGCLRGRSCSELGEGL